jgi:hypothetical protein
MKKTEVIKIYTRNILQAVSIVIASIALGALLEAANEPEETCELICQMGVNTNQLLNL